MEIVNSRYGKLIVSPYDKYLGKSLLEYGEFSQEEVDLFSKFVTKDFIVCDVGANIGAHTLAFSRMAKQVFAFEPVPFNFNALAGMIALNDLSNVQAFQMGISDENGLMSYPDLDIHQENNFGAASLGDFNGERAVQTQPLSIPCDFLKIDVEGMEVRVLRGAKDVIRMSRPVIYLEADRGKNFEEISRILDEYDYAFTWHTPPLYNPENFFGNKNNVFEDLRSFNLLCIPK